MDISVIIKTFAAGFSGKLEPGDIVTVMVSDYGERKETITPAELQYVQVLTVTAEQAKVINIKFKIAIMNIKSKIVIMITLTIKHDNDIITIL